MFAGDRGVASDGCLKGIGVCRIRLKELSYPPNARGKRLWEFAGYGRKQAVGKNRRLEFASDRCLQWMGVCKG